MEEAQKKGEWRVTRSGGLYGCSLVSDGEDGKTTAHTSVGPFRPDLDGADIALIARFCARFRFGVEAIANECRRADSQAMAERELERLRAEGAKQ